MRKEQRTMENKLVFELKIDDNSITGVYAISLVSKPAIEKNFVALNKQEPIKFQVDADKRILTGPVLIPNQYIYRRNYDRGEYYVYMSEETINQIVEKFYRGGFNSNTTHQHTFPLFGNLVVESWIIKDPNIDKSVLLGFTDLPVGTWMVSIKIEDEIYWQDYIKTGELKGFSIEGIFAELDTNTKLLKDEFKTVKKQLFMVTLETDYILIDGTVIKVNTDYTVSKQDGTLLEDGEYELEDGTYFEVFDTYLVAVYPPVYDEVMVEEPDNGLFAKVKEVFGFYSPNKKKKVKKRKINKKSLAQIIKDLIDLKMSKANTNKTNFAQLTTINEVVVTVDDTTNRVDVVDTEGMVIGYLEFVPTEVKPATDSTVQSQQTPIEMNKILTQLQELQEQVTKLSKDNSELNKVITEAVPNKVEHSKSDFNKTNDFLSTFVNQRKTN